MYDGGRTLLRHCHGVRLAGITRIFQQRGSEIDESRGSLELSFEGGRVLHLTTAINGLQVHEGSWTDPSGAPDDAWTREHGGPVRVDVSGRPEYAGAIGAPLHLGRWVGNEHGYLAGVELNLGVVALTFACWGDDEYVVFGRADALPREWGMQRFPTMVMEA